MTDDPVQKVNAMRSTAYLTDRAKAADWAAFDQLMDRPGGASPRDGDEVPIEFAKVHRV